MTFKELTQEDKDFFKKVYLDKTMKWDERMRVLQEYTGKSQRTISKWAVRLNLKDKPDVESKEFKKAKKREFNPKKKRFIITWAQNNTPVHERFFKNLEAYAKFIKADIHVIAGRYKNPTSIFSSSGDQWHDPVKKYLDAARHDIHKYVSIMSDIKIQPTAVKPMTGMQALSGINSCIFGSPKVQLEMIPVLEGCKPKMMLTTGACTVKNYTDSKAGKKGEFHHTLGFAIVEIKDESVFFVRQVTAEDNGNFIDLYYDVSFEGSEEDIVFETAMERMHWNSVNFGKEPTLWIGKTKIEQIDEVDACILGDLHYGKHDPEVLSKTFELMDILRPKHVVLHDVFDGDSINHHEEKDPFAQYRKEVKGTNSLKNEVDALLNGLEPFKLYENVVIVRSNHDDFLDRWLKNGDWKKQSTPKNSMEYMEYSQILLRQYAEGDEVKGVIPELINRKFPDFITLGRSDSYIVNGWELAQHGDIGSGGSRGSLDQFRKLNTKIIVGHYHAPGRIDGAVSVGTSTHLRIGYNVGASGWLQSHVILHKNGKTQHINFIDGEYTTF
jgi:hypothetical protein